MSEPTWRRLNKGEAIQSGDEIDACVDPWRDDAAWKQVSPKSIGKLAPDPQYPAHRQYRRRVSEPELTAMHDRHKRVIDGESVLSVYPGDAMQAVQAMAMEESILRSCGRLPYADPSGRPNE